MRLLLVEDSVRLAALLGEAVREAGLKFAVRQIRTLLDNGAPGIHLYSLNKASMCLQIAEEVGAL